ncbi:MAG TPA: alpha/beta hydrolase [Acidimicrobiales bacterium]|nr:alpha/beta hydrolase [Acidimicrobiales bacterium]
MANVALSYDDNGHRGTPAYLFVHGWTCDRSFFKPQYDHFGANARAVAVDLRGHGKSPLAEDGDYSIAAFAGDLAALIDELGLAPAIVVGHSLGGVITCALAASYPDKVAAALMVDPAPFVWPESIRSILEATFSAVNSPDGAAARAGLVDMMFMATDDAARKAAIAEAMAVAPQEVAGPAIASLLDFDGPAALAAVQCPIASIGSDGPVNDALEMKRINPNVLIGQTLGAGHFNQLEVPDQVNAMLERFVRISL